MRGRREGWGHREARSGQGVEAHGKLWAFAPRKRGSRRRAQREDSCGLAVSARLALLQSWQCLRGQERRRETR